MQWAGKDSTVMIPQQAELKHQCQEKRFVMPLRLSDHPRRILCKLEKQLLLWPGGTPDQPSDLSDGVSLVVPGKVWPCGTNGDERLPV